MIVTLALGVGLWLAAMMVQNRDVGQILPVAIQMLTFASPVYYTVSPTVPERLLPYYFIKPLVGVLMGFRWSLLGDTVPFMGRGDLVGGGVGAGAAVGCFYVQKDGKEVCRCHLKRQR